MSFQSHASLSSKWDLSGVEKLQLDEPIYNSPRLEVGTHTVVITSAQGTVGKYGPQMVLEVKDVAGPGTAKVYVSPTFKDQSSGKVRFTAMYSGLGFATVDDLDFRQKFFCQDLPNNLELASALAGSVIKVVISPPKKGFDIKQDEVTGKFYIIEVESGRPLLSTDEYGQASDAIAYDSRKDAATSLELQGLPRAYNRATEIRKADGETGNEARLRQSAAQKSVVSSAISKLPSAFL